MILEWLPLEIMRDLKNFTFVFLHVQCKQNTILITNVWHKIIFKRFSTKECWYLLKIELPMFIASTIGLLLQIHNTRCNLHIYPSIVEILQNSIWKFAKPCFLKEINIWQKKTNIFEKPKKVQFELSFFWE
jgi:hypothetical protein